MEWCSEEEDGWCVPSSELHIGEFDVSEYLYGAKPSPWRETPMTAAEAAHNQETLKRIAQAVKDGARLTCLGGCNGRTPREGSGLGKDFVLISNDPPSSGPDVATSLSSVMLESAPFCLSRDWTNLAFMDQIPNGIFWAILFHQAAAQYINAFALSQFASKLAPGGRLILQIICHAYGKEEPIQDHRYEFVFNVGGAFHGICYTPPCIVRGVLEELEEQYGRFEMSVVAPESDMSSDAYPFEEAHREFLRANCAECGIPFVSCTPDNWSAHLCEPGILSAEECSALTESVGEDVLRYAHTPVVVIRRVS
jgi:hypothetical protein